MLDFLIYSELRKALETHNFHESYVVKRIEVVRVEGVDAVFDALEKVRVELDDNFDKTHVYFLETVLTELDEVWAKFYKLDSGEAMRISLCRCGRFLMVSLTCMGRGRSFLLS